MRRTYDVVALITGVLLTAVALGALWLAFVGPLPWSVIKIVAPLGLVAIGVCGLALSRSRSQTETQKGDHVEPLSPTPPKKLTRSRSNRIVGGVCGGVAEYLNMDVTLVRILTVLISLFTGVPVILYIIALFVIPEGNRADRAAAGDRCSPYSGPFSGTQSARHRPRTPLPTPKRGGSGRKRASDRRGRRLGH